MTYKNFMAYLIIISTIIIALIIISALWIGDTFFAAEEWQNPHYLCVDDGGKWIENEQRCDCGVGRHNVGNYCIDD